MMDDYLKPTRSGVFMPGTWEENYENGKICLTLVIMQMSKPDKNDERIWAGVIYTNEGINITPELFDYDLIKWSKSTNDEYVFDVKEKNIQSLIKVLEERF